MESKNLLLYTAHFKHQYIHLIEMIKKDNKWLHIDFKKNINYLDEVKELSEKYTIKHVLFFPLQYITELYFTPFLSNKINTYISGKKVIFCDDIHRDIDSRIKVYNKFDYVMGPTVHRIPYFLKGYFTKKTIFFPPFVIKEDMVPNNKMKLNKLFLSGTIHPDIYPLRHLIHTLSKNNLFKRSIQNLDKNKKVKGENYFKIINNYNYGFCCSLSEKYQYLVFKFLEIPASSTILVCNNKHIKELFEEMGFYENIHYIAKNSENEIKDFILNLDKIPFNNKMCNDAYNLIYEKHTQYNRFQLLKEIFEF